MDNYLKNHTESDINKRTYVSKGVEHDIRSISTTIAEIDSKPLWFHKQKLMQTATGYGSKLKTEYMLKFNNRMMRIYCHQYSNVGTLYIQQSNGKKIIIDL